MSRRCEETLLQVGCPTLVREALMSTTSNGGKGVVGGLVSLCVVGGLIYLRVMRAQDRADRRHQQDAAFESDHRLWKSHALEMMKNAPDAKGVGDYLSWGVETFHDEADAEAMDSMVPDGAAYRDILITKIYD